MKAQIFSNGISLKISTCKMKGERLNVSLIFETPEIDLAKGHEVFLNLSTGERLPFTVISEKTRRRYEAELSIMSKLNKETKISASPNQAISGIATSELKDALSGGFNKDYILNNFAYVGSLWGLVAQIEMLTETQANLTSEGISFQGIPKPLQVGKLINTSLNTQDKKQFELVSFSLLPCTVSGREARKLAYNFISRVVEVSF